MVNVVLLSYTQFPQKTVANAAKLCYSSSSIEDLADSLTDEKVNSFLDMLNQIGHESPIEHANFTFGVEGISRTCSHQLVRHRIASYSQQSQRYVDMENFEPVIPVEILNNDEALALFNKAVEQTKTAYNEISDALLKSYVDGGMNKKIAKKKAIENARAILPNACETKIVVTMNARSLMNFFKHRCCARAQEEIREVADLMLKEVKSVAPELFQNAGPSCLKGNCPEGKMSCGKIVEMRKKYKEM